MNGRYPDYGLGQRLDGTNKGPGFASAELPDGSVMTEFGAGDMRYPNPFGALYPTVYEGITPWDLQTLAHVATYGWDPLQEDVFDRAYEAAVVRAGEGKLPFWTAGEPTQSQISYMPYWGS